MYSSLGELNNDINKCTACSLAQTRNHVVCGVGCRDAAVFLLGEAPGGNEDLSGRPFTGQAGKELDEFLRVLGLSRDEIYIGNTVKCRPTRPSTRGRYGPYANRRPVSGEIKACAPWLEEEICLVSPKILVTLGGVPLSRILGKSVKIGDYRGREFFSEKFNCRVFPLYHPASVIYDKSKREAYLADLEKLSQSRHIFATSLTY